MARQQNIGSSEDWFIGEDKTLKFAIYDGSTEATIQDVSAFAMAFFFRKIGESDKKLFTKTTGGSTITITGSFNATPATNTQRVNVIIDDTDTDNLQPGQYQYWLWRTDAGTETVLAYVTAELKPARV